MCGNGEPGGKGGVRCDPRVDLVGWRPLVELNGGGWWWAVAILIGRGLRPRRAHAGGRGTWRGSNAGCGVQVEALAAAGPRAEQILQLTLSSSVLHSIDSRRSQQAPSGLPSHHGSTPTPTPHEH